MASTSTTSEALAHAMADVPTTLTAAARARALEGVNDGPHPASNGGLPLACTLRPDDGSARLRRWQRLHETAAPSIHLVDGELEVRYQPGHGVRDELRSLAAAEQVCCSFVLWAVTEDAGHLVLHVTAPPETPHAVEPIAIMFGATTANRTSSQ